MLSRLEPCVLLTLALGLFYSICVLAVEHQNYRCHFMVLTFVLCLALFLLSAYFCFKRRGASDIQDFIAALRRK